MLTFRTITIGIIMLLGISEANCQKPELQISTSDVSCFGGEDGKIHVLVQNHIEEFQINLFKNSPTGISLYTSGENDSLVFTANQLSAAKYTLEIKGSKGYSSIEYVEVKQPEQLNTTKIEVVKKLSTKRSSDATLKVSPIGGVPPYTYLWNVEGKINTSPLLENISQGIYNCIIDDKNNCGPVKATIIFTEHVIQNIAEE